MRTVQKRVHETLVNRLRKSCRVDPMPRHPYDHAIADKLDAIGEALAYIIDKKHAKRKLKSAKSAK